MFARLDSPDVRMRITRFRPLGFYRSVPGVWRPGDYPTLAQATAHLRSTMLGDYTLYADYAALEERVAAWAETAPRYNNLTATGRYPLELGTEEFDHD